MEKRNYQKPAVQVINIGTVAIMAASTETIPFAKPEDYDNVKPDENGWIWAYQPTHSLVVVQRKAQWTQGMAPGTMARRCPKSRRYF